MEVLIVLVVLGLMILLIYRTGPNKSGSLQGRQDISRDRQATRYTRGHTWGKFNVVGYHHLSEEAKRLLQKELIRGEELELWPDPQNQTDPKAIKVTYKDQHIGWVPRDHRRKIELFSVLQKGIKVKVICLSNIRTGDYRWTGKGKHREYRGMANFVEAKFEYHT